MRLCAFKISFPSAIAQLPHSFISNQAIKPTHHFSIKEYFKNIKQDNNNKKTKGLFHAQQLKSLSSANNKTSPVKLI